MPLYPFALLLVLFLGIITLPPLIAAFINERWEAQRARGEDQDG